MWLEFSVAVNTAKQEKIWNLGQLPGTIEWWGLPLLPETDISEYFKRVGINRETIKDFLLSMSEDYSTVIEGQFTNIDSMGEWYDEILWEIENMWPFFSPEDLITAISKCIKKHMSYDTFVALNQVLWTSTDISQVLDDPEASFTNYHISVIESVFWCFREEGSFIEAELPDDYRIMIESLLSLDTPQQLTQYVRQMSKDERILFKEMISIISMELRNTKVWNSDSVTDVLKERKVWVCRHFSVIAKKIYNDIVSNSNSIKFDWESEVIYVVNAKLSHAYNVLMHEWKDGSMRKVYFDITHFLSNWSLFPTIEDLKGRNPKNEIYVENNSPTKNQQA